jgi:hypothetical protein
MNEDCVEIITPWPHMPKERSLDWDRPAVRKRLGAIVHALVVAGDETVTHGLPTAGCKRL